MPKFIFPLDGVLRQRKQIEQQRQRELAVFQGQMAAHQAELKALNDAMAAVTADVRSNRLVGPLDLAFLAAHRRYEGSMQRKGMAIVQKMAVVQRDLDAAQRLLTEAAKARKVIEKLREKQHERWAIEQARKEQAELDEMGMQLSYRNAVEADALAEGLDEPEPAS